MSWAFRFAWRMVKPAGLGAARLARLAVTGEDPLAICYTAAPRRDHRSGSTLAAAYAEALVRWRALYPALRSATG